MPRLKSREIILVVVGLLSLAGLYVGADMAEIALKAYTIPASSMAPTLLVGDFILVNKLAYESAPPRRGDIIVFLYPNDESRDFIKRIIAVGGDTIQVRDNRVWLNGVLQEEPYVRGGSVPANLSAYCGYVYGCDQLTVPAGSYFVMGDYRDNSQDSRYWGFVRGEKIRGKAFLIYWSWDRVAHGPRWGRIGLRVR